MKQPLKKHLRVYAKRKKIHVSARHTRNELICEIARSSKKTETEMQDYFQTWHPSLSEVPADSKETGDSTTWVERLEFRDTSVAGHVTHVCGILRRFPSFFSPTGDAYFATGEHIVKTKPSARPPSKSLSKSHTGLPVGLTCGTSSGGATNAIIKLPHDRELEVSLRSSYECKFATASELRLREWKHISANLIEQHSGLPRVLAEVVAAYTQDTDFEFQVFHTEPSGIIPSVPYDWNWGALMSTKPSNAIPVSHLNNNFSTVTWVRRVQVVWLKGSISGEIECKPSFLRNDKTPYFERIQFSVLDLNVLTPGRYWRGVLRENTIEWSSDTDSKVVYTRCVINRDGYVVLGYSSIFPATPKTRLSCFEAFLPDKKQCALRLL
jgi:hypothetical protein